MTSNDERRREQRIRFSWPLWFTYEGKEDLHHGQVVDLTPTHVGFTVDKDQCPQTGQHLMVRFSYPLNFKNNFEMKSYLHWAEVTRVNHSSGDKMRIAMRLHQPISIFPETKETDQATVAQSA